MSGGVGGPPREGRSYPYVCRVRLTILWVILTPWIYMVKGKSLTQPDGGEGCSGITTGFLVTGPGRQWPRYGEVPQTHGATNRNRIRRAWWDEPATQGEVLYPSRPGTYIRRSRGERREFTPGGPSRVPVVRD